MRAAYDALDERDQGRESRTWSASTRQIFRAAARLHRLHGGGARAFAPVRQRLVRTHPSPGASLFLASHAGAIVGWPVPEARVFLRDLIEHATQRRVRLRAHVAAVATW